MMEAKAVESAAGGRTEAGGPTWKVIHADCREALRKMKWNSVDAIVCDPPYGLEFMGKEFDSLGDGPGQQAWHLAWAKEALLVLKPGGHLVAFGGTRTYHRLACALEDAGFEIRDSLVWMYGTGFPKSQNVGKAFDKKAGAQREVLGVYKTPEGGQPLTTYNNWQDKSIQSDSQGRRQPLVTAAATDLAKKWDGWGTALKPAFEPIVLARKPLEGTVAANVQKWGVGALNIDATRIHSGPSAGGSKSGSTVLGVMNDDGWTPEAQGIDRSMAQGRWPANVVLDEEAGALLDVQSGVSKSTGGKGAASGLIDNPSIYGKFSGLNKGTTAGGLGDAGGASRFFYCAKTSRQERNLGTDALYWQKKDKTTTVPVTKAEWEKLAPESRAQGNNHPTVKPVSLMRWLIRLVTPKDGLVLDPFCGSGSTGLAAARENVRFVGIEKDENYAAIARARLEAPLQELPDDEETEEEPE